MYYLKLKNYKFPQELFATAPPTISPSKPSYQADFSPTVAVHVHWDCFSYNKYIKYISPVVSLPTAVWQSSQENLKVILQLGISLVYLLCSSIMAEEAYSRCYCLSQKCHSAADVQDPLASPSSLQMVWKSIMNLFHLLGLWLLLLAL